MTVSATFVPRRVPEVVAAVFDEEAVLYHPTTSRLHLLNATGSVVWQLCDGGVTLAGLIDELTDGFDAERSVVADGVTAVVEQLVEARLLTDRRGGQPRTSG